MLADYLRTLMDYHDWATQSVLGACIDINENDYHRDLGLTGGTLHGALNAGLQRERQWRLNFLGDNSFHEEAPIKGRDQLARALREESRQWQALVADITDDSLKETITVVGCDRLRYTLTKSDLITQVINYGIQERATIAHSIDWLGQPRPAIDFIAYQQTA